MNNGKFFSARKITSFAILFALVIVLQTFGATINIGPVQLNFTLIPIVLGSLMLGPIAGGLLGLACGVVVLIQVIMGLVPFYTLIWTETPFYAAMTCLVKTTVAGYLSGLIYKLLVKKNAYLAVFIASAIVPIVNTGLCILGCLCMWNTIGSMANGTNVFIFIIVSLVTFNFFAEFAVNLLVAPALHTVYKAVEKQFKM